MDAETFYKQSTVEQAEYLRTLDDDQLWDWAGVAAAHVNSKIGEVHFDELTILGLWTAAGKVTRTQYNRLACRDKEVGDARNE